MRKFSWLLLLIILAVSCNKEKEFDYPLVYTGEVTDIKNDGAVFSAKIVDLSNLEVIEYGFVWDHKTNPTIESSEKYVISEPPRIGVFNQHISTTLQAGVKYYVRTYIRNSKYITYGKEVVFTSLGSLAPQIIDFMPKTGNLKDTLTIIGHNFSYKASNNQVKIGEFQTTVIKANQDTLIVKVPEKLNSLSSPISVSIQGNKTVSTYVFNLISPVISDFQEKIGTFGSQITISGNNFLANPTTLKVYFDNFNARIADIQNQSLIVFVPDSLNKRQSNIKIRMNNITVTSIDKFQIAPLSINEFSPKVALTGATITITGSNFSPIKNNNRISIGGHTVTATNASSEKLEFILPSQDLIIYPSRNNSIKIDVFGEIKEFSDSLVLNDKWFRLKDAPTSISRSGYAYSHCNCFVYNNKLYIGLNDKENFWEYNPLNDVWKKLADFPGKPRFDGAGFVIGDNLYYGTGASPDPFYEYFSDWWKYDFSSNAWTQLNNFSGKKRTGAVAFQINNFGYLGTGEGEGVITMYSDFWKYDPNLDTWAPITNYPRKMRYGIGLVNLNKAYVGLGDEYSNCNKFVYEYSPENNTWQNISDFPYCIDYYCKVKGFCFNNKIFLKPCYNLNYSSYDEINNKWIFMPEFFVPASLANETIRGVEISLNNKIYTGLGYINKMWVFDPSR